MFNLDIESMCENTASDKIHIWYPDSKEDSIDSFETDDSKLAAASFLRGGASLYFGSSLEFRNRYCKALTYQLGMNFGAYFNDFSSKAEIETFVTQKGNFTHFHTDFQENFTV